MTGFVITTTLANQISRAANKEVRKIIDAKTASGRAYQTAELILRLYRFGTRDRLVPDSLLRAARVVYQQVSLELTNRDYENRMALGEKGRRSTAPDLLSVVSFMLAPGNSSYDAAIKFDRDASSLRERLNDSLDIIEAKYGSFCKDIPLTPQTRARAGYNRGIEDRKSAPPTLDHEAEAARYRREEAAAYLEVEEWLRDAYRALAEHFERGGHIFYGHTAHGVARGLYDGRSGRQVLREAGVVEPEERFPPAKAKRLRPNIEHGIDVGLRLGLADTVAGIGDDTAPIRDTRESASTVLMREVSPFFVRNLHIITLRRGIIMRKNASRFAERITAALADRGVLGFSQLMVATTAPNNQILSRNLRRLRRDGRISRTVLATTPPSVLYALADLSESKSGDRLAG
jgi:hypothetical protein